MRRLDVRKRIQLQYQRLLFILAAVQRRAEMWSGHFKFIGRGWRYKTIGSAGNDTRPIAPGRGAVYGGELVECMQYRSCNSVFSLQCVFSIDKLFKSPASPGAAHNKQSKFACRGIDGIV